jgi:dolichol-phosphate mannosyltransferase
VSENGGPAVWVVLPTFEEAENVVPMLEALVKVLDRASLNGRVLVVDDSSPDGTAELVREVSRREPRVDVVVRPEKAGIGPAYRQGFAHALAGGADLIVQMDCDFSHDPAVVPQLVTAAQEADLVLGSRYVRGGGVTKWGALRRAISRGGCLYAKAMLGVSVNDLTGGFKCWRREVLDAIPLEQVSAAGYGFQIEMTYRTLRMGYSVVEVPITFSERSLGSSKMGSRIVFEAAVLVPGLRRRVPATRRERSEDPSMIERT